MNCSKGTQFHEGEDEKSQTPEAVKYSSLPKEAENVNKPTNVTDQLTQPMDPGSIPMIDENNIDDSDEGFPLITSVYSLASEEEPTKYEQDTLSEPNTSNKPEMTLEPEGNKPPLASRLSAGSGSIYTGHEQFILPKVTETNLSIGKTSQSMASYTTTTLNGRPSITGSTKSSPLVNTSGVSKSTVSIENATNLNHIWSSGSTPAVNNQQKITVSSPGCNLAGSVTQVSTQVPVTAAAPSISLRALPLKGGNVVQLQPVANVQNASGQTVQVPLTNFQTNTSSLPGTVTTPSPVSRSSTVTPLVQMIDRMSPVISGTTVLAPAHGSGTILTTSPRSSTIPQLRPTVPVSIAPVPQQIINTQPAPKGVANVSRLVMITKQGSTNVPGQTGQLVYLVDAGNTIGDGKAFRIVLPEGAKLVTSPVSSSNPNALSLIPTSPVSTSSLQHVRIVPKPILTSPQPQTVLKAMSSSISVAASTNTLLNAANTGNVFLVPQNVAAKLETASATPQTLFLTQDMPKTKPEVRDVGFSATSLKSPECPRVQEVSSTTSLESGVSPHEARIQKLKELLKKQEEAVDRLREKRRKELEQIRESSSKPATTGDPGSNEGDGIKPRKTESSSPFLVPLPPKKARLESYRGKQTKTPKQQGFLPSGEDTNFVKLVGLEDVVKKLKEKHQAV